VVPRWFLPLSRALGKLRRTPQIVAISVAAVNLSGTDSASKTTGLSRNFYGILRNATFLISELVDVNDGGTPIDAISGRI